MARTARQLTSAYRLAVASRAAAALFGGYVIGALSAVVIAAMLPVAKADAVLFGTMAGFLISGGVAIWVFAVGSATKAWMGVVATAVAMSAAYFVLRGNP